jgi:hypothetical protein
LEGERQPLFCADLIPSLLMIAYSASLDPLSIPHGASDRILINSQPSPWTWLSLVLCPAQGNQGVAAFAWQAWRSLAAFLAHERASDRAASEAVDHAG